MLEYVLVFLFILFSFLFVLNIYLFYTETNTEQREKIVFVLLPLCQTFIWKK